jgi:glycosyltransferase involved in cell wall biosynthesis
MPARILVVLPLMPWPPRRDGMAVRFLPILEHLARRHTVDLVIVDDRVDTKTKDRLPMLRSIDFLYSTKRRIPAPLRRLLTALRGIAPFGAPLGQMDYRNRSAIVRELRERISCGNYAAVLVSGAAWMMTAAMRYPKGCRVIYDFVDSPTLHMRRGGWLNGLERHLQRHTERKCARLEREIRRFATKCIYISKPDAEAIGPDAPEAAVIPNGVLEDGNLTTDLATPTRPVVGFLGNMGYVPNIKAVRRLALEVMPHIRDVCPEAELLVIGRNPADEVLSLRSSSVVLTGTVDDIWPYVRKVRVFVFPMLSGAGLQNKILEAMHAGIPVVTTSLSQQSMGTVPGTEVLVADNDRDIAQLTTSVIHDEALWQRLSRAGRRFVHEHHSWASLAVRYENTVLGPW